MIYRLGRNGLLLLGALSIAAWVGCGEDNPLGRKAVSGMVTLDGKPLSSGSIQFAPLDKGPVLGGCNIKEGSYTIAAEKGLPPGKYLVRISAPDMSFFETVPAEERRHSKPPNLAPPEYGSESKITITVTGEGPNEFNFDMKSAK